MKAEKECVQLSGEGALLGVICSYLAFQLQEPPPAHPRLHSVGPPGLQGKLMACWRQLRGA